MKHVHFISEDEFVPVQEGEVEQQTEEISYIQNNQGGYNKGYYTYKANPNLSYRSTNVANPQDQVYPPQTQQSQPQTQQSQQPQQVFIPRSQFVSHQGGFQPRQQQGAPPGFAPQQVQAPQLPEPDMKAMLQQLLQGQANGAMELSKKLAEMNTKIETLNSRVQHVESNATSTSSAKQGQLPGKAVQNPKEYAHAITLRSGKELSGPTVNEDIEVQEGEGYTENLNLENHSETELDVQTRCVDQARDRVGQPNPTKPVETKRKETLFVPPPYKPPLPFPGRFKKQLVKKYKDLFDKQMKEIEVRMPLIDAFMLVPPYQKFLKDAVMERTRELQGMVVLSHECSAIIQRKVIQEKLGDPGSFTLPCSLGPLAFNNCLCDLGASVSLMPLSVAKRLGFEKFKPCKISLVLADRSVRLPTGLLEDLPIRIGNVEVPTDFIVLEMDEEPKDPLILGRPFLATAGAVIDVRKGKIDLHLGKDFLMKFDIKDAMKKPTIEGQIFYVEEVDQLADELMEELSLPDHLQIALTRNEGSGFLHEESMGYVKLLDSHVAVTVSEPFEELGRTESEVVAVSSAVSDMGVTD